MRDEQQLLLHRQQAVLHRTGVAQVEQRRRLVGDHDRGLAGQHARDRQQLLLAAGEGVHGGVRAVGEPDLGQHVPGARLPLALVLHVPTQRQGDVLQHGRHDELGRRLGEHEPDPPAHRGAVGRDVEAVHADRAGRGCDEPVDEPDERRLARAVGAHDDDATLRQARRDVAQEHHLAVRRRGGDGDVVELDGRHGASLAHPGAGPLSDGPAAAGRRGARQPRRRRRAPASRGRPGRRRRWP